MMDVIETMAELLENLRTFEGYIDSADIGEREFHQDHVKRGICFVAYQRDTSWHFAPSRFAGYKHNTMTAHLQNDDKDGKDTNPAIARLLGRYGPDEKLEIAYVRFCSELGFPAREAGARGYPRKYWRFPRAI